MAESCHEPALRCLPRQAPAAGHGSSRAESGHRQSNSHPGRRHDGAWCYVLCGPASSSCSSNLPESTAILAARGDDRREAQTKIMGAKRLTAFYIYMAAKR